MRGPAALIAGWGLLMAAILGVGLVAFGFEGPESPALFGGVALTMVVLGAFLVATGRNRVDPTGARVVADRSPAAAWMAVSLVALALSAELGFGVALIAAGMLGLALGGLYRELAAQRHAARALRCTARTPGRSA